jgi:hypothetical protein
MMVDAYRNPDALRVHGLDHRITEAERAGLVRLVSATDLALTDTGEQQLVAAIVMASVVP